MLFYLYLPHLPSQISFTLKCISRTFVHLSCPLCIKLTCLGSGLCDSFHISELWVAHVRIWLVSELPGSSASARCYVLFVCKNEEQYTIELDSSFKQKAYFFPFHFFSSEFIYTYAHTDIHHSSDRETTWRRSKKVAENDAGLMMLYKSREWKEERRDRERGQGGKQKGGSQKLRRMRQWTRQASKHPALSYILMIATHHKWTVKAKKNAF